VKEEGVWGAVHLLLLITTIFFKNQFSPLNRFYISLSLLLLLVGVVIFSFSWKELGEVRIGVLPGKSLITTGIYSKIRHPIYLGIKLIYLGLALFFKSTVTVILFFVLLFPVHMYRVRREEQELIKRFGEEYLEYKKRTLF
jgi:protein-S-isoprenylcysteine O-methyltransferase Ste14